MKRIALLFTLTFVVGVLSGILGMRALNAQSAPPTQPSGDRVIQRLASLELGAQIPELRGRYLRARVVTFGPGARGRLHRHADRPQILYVLEGTFSDCSPDGKCAQLGPGQVKAEGKDVVHWPENRGKRPLAFLAVDISKER